MQLFSEKGMGKRYFKSEGQPNRILMRSRLRNRDDPIGSLFVKYLYRHTSIDSAQCSSAEASERNLFT
jgi:hypothetical protein